MARKYSRDNRGRFASSGSGGATARGGRLKTASGKKRQAQTMKAAGAGGAGVMKGKVQRDPGAAGKIGSAGTAMSARGRVLATPKQSQVALAGGGRMKPLRGVGAAVKGNITGFKGLPVSIRSRSQSIAAQKERNRRMYEYAMSAPGRDGRGRSEQSISVRKTRVNQGNLLTGKTDNVTVRAKAKMGDTKIGVSQAAKKNQRRRDRATARYEGLLAERQGLLGQRKAIRSGVLAKNSQRMGAVGNAFRVYDMGTGRKPRRKTTARR